MLSGKEVREQHNNLFTNVLQNKLEFKITYLVPDSINNLITLCFQQIAVLPK